MARILLVDDEALIRDTLRQVLESAGHDVVEASNGTDALAAFDPDTMDLIITDIVMPDKEGIETIIDILRQKPDMKIIAISGGSGPDGVDYLSLARKFGARDILSKPFRKQQILESVSQVLAGVDP